MMKRITLLIFATLLFPTAHADTEAMDHQARDLDIPVTQLRNFAEVLERVRLAYVEEVDEEELLHSAIRGMLMDLDPHSSYLEPDDFDELQESTEGEFGGLGIEITMEDDRVKVVTPYDDTPASKAGLKANDTILAVDEESTKGMNLEEVVKLLRGDKGSEVTLTIMPADENTAKDVTLKRDIIEVKSVRYKTLQPGYGYLRISQFQTKTARDARNAIQSLQEDDKLKGLVLDLRNNPGGILDGAVDIADLFLESGLIVYTKGRNDETQKEYKASQKTEFADTPLVVLVNEGSASASEIVAGALQDQDRAVLIGQRTFGKGSVQSVLPLSGDSALKLTTARYYTPNGRSIQADGIHPDITLAPAKVDTKKNRILREADLPRHLTHQAEEDIEDDDNSLAQEDYELYQALSLLKGIVLSKGKNRH